MKESKKNNQISAEYTKDVLEIQRNVSNFKWIAGILFALTAIAYAAIQFAINDGMYLSGTDIKIPNYFLYAASGYTILRASMLWSKTSKMKEKYPEYFAEG